MNIKYTVDHDIDYGMISYAYNYSKFPIWHLAITILDSKSMVWYKVDVPLILGII